MVKCVGSLLYQLKHLIKFGREQIERRDDAAVRA